MLKSKKALFILVPLVFAIWGMVIYQVIDGLDTELPISEDFELGSFRESDIKTEELLELHMPERDPFLGTIAVKKASQNQKNSKIGKETIVETPWHTIEYLGYVKKESRSGLRAVAIRIDGTGYILKTGSIQDSLKLVKATDDYIIMRYKKKDKKFKKE